MLWFRNQNLFKKLMLAFGLVGVFVAALGAFSIVRLGDLNTRLVDMNENWMPSIRDLMNLKADLMENRTYQYGAQSQVLFQNDSPERAAAIAEFARKSGDLQTRDADISKHYATTITGPEEKVLWDEAAKKLDAYWMENADVFKAVRTGDREAAYKAVEKAREIRHQATAALQNDLDFNSKNADKVVEDSKQAYLNNRLLLVLSTIVLIGMGLGLGYFIARAISRPVRRASELADAIANGKLENDIAVESQDETGHLLASMKQMQETIKNVVAAQATMASEHHQGATSYRIVDTAFPGTYGTMAKQVNEMVAEHIGVTMRIVEVVTAYAEGNFAVDMDRLPKEKGKITQAIDGVKGSFQSISHQIKELVAAAGRGDFSVRGDAKAYKYEFQEMVIGLNELMGTCDNSLSEIARVLSALAEGDLTQHVDGQFQGTFGQLKDDANKTVESLKSIVAEIRVATESINTAASEIAQGNMDLSGRTESQAASLEETAASMEELTSTVRQTADNAQQSSKQADDAAQVATVGGEAVAKVVATMKEISESSKKIADIIGVIDGIAFQTNILALNAAVEAARAGEQGRGFAVVASEVRSLAQRSAAAAKEIKDLISTSVEKVEIGARQVDEAGKTIGTTVSSVDRVRQFITDISSATLEQSAGIEQVNSAVTQMDQVTQQNAALVEEAAAAAKSLEEQARSLSNTVARFRIDASAATVSEPLRVVRAPLKPALQSSMHHTAKPRLTSSKRTSAVAVAELDGEWQEF